MEIELRNERFSDYPETENVVREAFWNRYSPGCYEHYLIHIMRYSRAFVPQLDFVAVFDDKIVGNIVFFEIGHSSRYRKRIRGFIFGAYFGVAGISEHGYREKIDRPYSKFSQMYGLSCNLIMRGSRLLFAKGICACRDLRNTDSRRHVCRCVACVRVI